MKKVSDLILRPTREVYDPQADLGPRLFFLQSRVFKRTDFQLRNKRNLVLQCSHFEPIGFKAAKLPCVVYCHGNCGSRIDSFETVENMLPRDITVFAFDFAGSGCSEGEFVSLGYYEQDDIDAVVTFLNEEMGIQHISLWGRSMGAVSSLLYASKQPQKIKCLIFDSPFSNLQKILQDIVKNLK